MAVTGWDVANAAGVSQATVSRALRGSPLITAETAARVRAAAERLGYVPSEYGRQLRTKRSHRVGVLATELDNPFYMALLDPIHTVLREHGYSTVVLTESASSPVTFAELVDGSLDGVILTNCRIDSSLPGRLRSHGLAVVTVNREVQDAAVDSCVVANAQGAALVASELLATAHRRIAAIEGPQNTSTGRQRARGFRRALSRAGIRVQSRQGEFAFDTGHQGLTELVAGARPPTAVFCANDVMAFGALDAAAALGLQVPDEVSIVGFDDIAMAGWERFDLATVRCDLTALGRRGAELIVRRIDKPQARLVRDELQPRFVRRGSLGPPR